jgi:hypothetical protein
MQLCTRDGSTGCTLISTARAVVHGWEAACQTLSAKQAAGVWQSATSALLKHGLRAYTWEFASLLCMVDWIVSSAAGAAIVQPPPAAGSMPVYPENLQCWAWVSNDGQQQVHR